MVCVDYDNSVCSSLKTRLTPFGTPGVLSYHGTALGLRHTGFCLKNRLFFLKWKTGAGVVIHIMLWIWNRYRRVWLVGFFLSACLPVFSDYFSLRLWTLEQVIEHQVIKLMISLCPSFGFSETLYALWDLPAFNGPESEGSFIPDFVPSLSKME